MEIKISYKHLDSSPAIEEQVRTKATQLKKYFQGKMKVHWVCSVEKDIHSSEVKVTGSHFACHATAHSENLYKTFDEAIAKLEKQLSKRKDKVKVHKKTELAFVDEHVDGDEYADEAF